jgi:probable HAF family extracellular repeat protein
MRSRELARIAATAVAGLSISLQLAAQQHPLAQHHQYKLIDIGTFGGPNSRVPLGEFVLVFPAVINNHGAVVGGADTSSPDPYCLDGAECYVAHAFQWDAGIRADLGALVQSRNSSAEWISPNGLIAGFSENGEFDPLLGFTELRAVLWRNGRIIDLGTLPEGGYESWANAVNSKGEVVGWATNTVADPNSMTAGIGNAQQTRAFLWQKGSMRDLGTLGTGTDAIAQFIDERGQVFGWSYTGAQGSGSCAGGAFPMAVDSFIWDDEHGMRDLGTFGGTCTLALAVSQDGSVVGLSSNEQELSRAFVWKKGSMQDLGGSIGGQQATATAINESGQIVGFATLAGEVGAHAALWKRPGEITDLGTPDPSECSMALSINARTQIVGQSVDCVAFGSIHALLWDNGSLFDLNDLIPPGAALTLQFAENINDTGEIAGQGLDASGNLHAFLLIPCDAEHSNVAGCDYSLVDTRSEVRLSITLHESRRTPNAPRERAAQSDRRRSSLWLNK